MFVRHNKVYELLALLAVGVMSLSTIALRDTNSAKFQRIAQANARLSLQMALSRLQTLAGSDMRVTAPASAVQGVDGPHQLHGVWRSWQGTDRNRRGQPIPPDYDSKLQDADESGSGGGKFFGWLVSGDGAENAAGSPASLVEGNNTVALLAKGSLGEDADASDQVHLTPTEIIDDDGTVGGYAWWVQGENTKVRLKPSEVASDKMESSEQMLVSPGPSGSDFNIEDTSNVDLAVTRPSLDFMAEDDSVIPSEFFHDVSVSSKGLLTNTANGGWRRDLSLFSENFASIPEGFSSFTLSPGNAFEAGKSNVSSSSNLPLIYPWIDNWSRDAEFPDSVSWAALVDYATQYKQLRTSGDEVAEIMNATDRKKENWADMVRRIPVVARIHLVISLSAEQDSDPSKYIPAVLLNPVITLWNPYSVALDLSNRPELPLKINDAACPITFDFKVGRSVITTDLGRIAASATNNKSGIITTIPLNDPPVWLPGEVRVFSPTGNTDAKKAVGSEVTFEAGFRPDSGLRYTLPDAKAESSNATLAADKARLDATFEGPNVEGVGMYFTHTLGPGSKSTTNVQCMLDLNDAQRMLGQEVVLKSTSPIRLSELASAPQPILSSIVGLRYGRDTNTEEDDIVVNGIHNMNPIVGFMVNGALNDNSTTGGATGSETTNLKGRFDVFPYNIQLYPVNSFADPGVPSGIVGDLEGYLGSGFGSADGLSNLVLLEIPTRPLRSIGDLQHFNVNACDDSGPYTLNALGNSRPSPFIESDGIRVASIAGGDDVGHDHSYVINHVLLDDWFVSSVAPEMDDWSASERRGVETVYADHLSGLEPLPNHYYKPVRALSDAEAASEASDLLNDEDAWQKVAAELEVEGMFNINSTSELAWAMLLKRNFGMEDPGVLSLDNSTPGSGGSASLEQSNGSPFPRSSLISDSGAGAGGYSLLSQHQRFTDEQIDALAREIVVEIKKRGPFLSLSEFFNRQLSSDTELARAGAVESALLRLSEGPDDENPYKDLQASFLDEASDTDVLGGPLGYQFPEAAEGNPAYGFPGWTRQADVLRPISGILSARDDTFTIRAYGDARNPVTNEVVSRAWCEAVVQRRPEFVDSSDATGDDKHTLPSEGTLNSEANHRFGRGFEIVQFRWLHSDEV